MPQLARRLVTTAVERVVRNQTVGSPEDLKTCSCIFYLYCGVGGITDRATQVSFLSATCCSPCENQSGCNWRVIILKEMMAVHTEDMDKWKMMRHLRIMMASHLERRAVDLAGV